MDHANFYPFLERHTCLINKADWVIFSCPARLIFSSDRAPRYLMWNPHVNCCLELLSLVCL